MKHDEFSSHLRVENWSGLENYLSKNLRPVSPNSVFISNLRSRLENPDSVTLESVGKTSRFFFAGIGLVTGLLVMVLIARLFVQLFSRDRRSQSL